MSEFVHAVNSSLSVNFDLFLVLTIDWDGNFY